MITFEEACEKIYNAYIRGGFPGIEAAADAGNEWVFIQAPEKENTELPMGENPLFVNKSTGDIRRMEFFNLKDNSLLEKAKVISIPDKYKAYYR